MVTRRKFIQSVESLGAGALLGGGSKAFALANEQDVWFMPDESEPHQRTWMAFGASKKIWGSKLLTEVQRDLAAIALTIAKYEPVSMLVPEVMMPIARKLMSSSIELIACPINDLWMRDTGPVFVVTKDGDKAGIDFNFNGWGEKQEFAHDANVASVVTKIAGARRVRTNLVLEGGGIEVDGHGTAILTESCVLNRNRNPGVSKSACEAELKQLLGLERIIWLPGIKGKDITDGHTDFYARFVRPGVIVAGFDSDPLSFDHAVTKRHLEILRAAKDSKERGLEVVIVDTPSKVRDKFTTDDFAAGYINFYVCNGAVIAPEFGDAQADRAAKTTLQRLFPNREVVQINIDGIAAGGGGIHCTTQQEPKV